VDGDPPPGLFRYKDHLEPNGNYGAWIRTHRAVVQIGDGIFVHGGLNPLSQFGSIAELEERIRLELAAYDSIRKLLVNKKVIWRYMDLQESLRHVAEELKWMQASGKNEDSELVRQMQQFLGVENAMVLSNEGPLWYRGLASENEESLAAPLDAMLARLKAKYIVSGHTVTKTSIKSRFGNRVFLIDTGMLREAYGGRPAALEIKDGQFTDYYADGE